VRCVPPSARSVRASAQSGRAHALGGLPGALLEVCRLQALKRIRYPLGDPGARGERDESIEPKLKDCSMPKPTVFISYSHQDETWKERLVKHLSVLEEEGFLAVWDDRRIEADAKWLPEIESAMAGARVAVLLISAEFLTSKFIRQKEVPRLLERREKEGMRVIPVIARTCIWPNVGWLASIQAALGGKPLASLRGNKIDEAFTALAAEIEGLEHGDGGDGRPTCTGISPMSEWPKRAGRVLGRTAPTGKAICITQ